MQRAGDEKAPRAVVNICAGGNVLRSFSMTNKAIRSEIEQFAQPQKSARLTAKVRLRISMSKLERFLRKCGSPMWRCGDGSTAASRKGRFVFALFGLAHRIDIGPRNLT